MNLKKFFWWNGGNLGVLSIPVILFGAYWIYTPTIMFLQKQEYLEWVDCSSHLQIDAAKKGITGVEDFKEFQESVCGEKPNRWKFQPKDN